MVKNACSPDDDFGNNINDNGEQSSSTNSKIPTVFERLQNAVQCTVNQWVENARAKGEVAKLKASRKDGGQVPSAATGSASLGAETSTISVNVEHEPSKGREMEMHEQEASGKGDVRSDNIPARGSVVLSESENDNAKEHSARDGQRVRGNEGPTSDDDSSGRQWKEHAQRRVGAIRRESSHTGSSSDSRVGSSVVLAAAVGLLGLVICMSLVRSSSTTKKI